MKDGYDIFEKNGETTVRAWGNTERELFSHSLLGIAAMIRPDVSLKRKTVHVRAHIHGDGLSETLSNFLSHVLFENEMHNAVFSALDVIHFSPSEIECELIGKEVDHVEEEVSAISLVGKGVERRVSGRWEVEFVPIFV